jgi:hypothetical protein
MMTEKKPRPRPKLRNHSRSPYECQCPHCQMKVDLAKHACSQLIDLVHRTIKLCDDREQQLFIISALSSCTLDLARRFLARNAGVEVSDVESADVLDALVKVQLGRTAL